MFRLGHATKIFDFYLCTMSGSKVVEVKMNDSDLEN